RELESVLAEVDDELRVVAVAVLLDESLRLHLGVVDEAPAAVGAGLQPPVRDRLGLAPVVPIQAPKLQGLHAARGVGRVLELRRLREEAAAVRVAEDQRLAPGGC